MVRTQRPTWRSLHLAEHLHRLRRGSGLTSLEVAEQLGWDNSKVSRIENAKVYVTPTDCAHLLDLYGAGHATRASLLQLARDAKKRGWWASYGDAFATSFVDMEDVAVEINEWENQVIPGLLQTPEYARSLIRNAFPEAGDADIDRRLRARMARKPLLHRENAPYLHAVVDETAFRRAQADSPSTLVGQARALLDVPSNVTLQVLPFAAGLNRGVEGSFVLLKFAEELGPPKAYCETPGGHLYVESADDIRRCTLSFDSVQNATLSPGETADWLNQLVKECST